MTRMIWTSGMTLGLRPADETALQINVVSHWLSANLESIEKKERHWKSENSYQKTRLSVVILVTQ